MSIFYGISKQTDAQRARARARVRQTVEQQTTNSFGDKLCRLKVDQKFRSPSFFFVGYLFGKLTAISNNMDGFKIFAALSKSN